MPAAPATRAEIQRAIDAALNAGLNVSGVSVGKDGTVHVNTSPKDDKPSAKVLKPKQWDKNAS